MYVAMFCIGEEVFFMRRWEDVQYFVTILAKFYRTTKKKRYVIYVHNLGFEFQFMRNFFEWEEIFAVDERVPVRALTIDGIEFRCSWKLTNMSLQKFLEKTPNVVNYKKESKKRNAKKGEYFDYSIFRTPDTDLEEFEWEYCYCDVKGLHEGLEERLKDDNLCTIPMTSTGYVRRDCRIAMQKNPRNRELLQECEFDEFIYLLLRTMRRGGDCTSSPLLSGELLHDVDSWDIKSSYPYIMMTQLMPMGQWVKDSCKYLSKNRCYIICVTFINIRLKDKTHIPYIPFAKCTKKEKPLVCNGRIIKAKSVSMVIADFDYNIIKERYDFDEEIIMDGYSCRGELLPYEFRCVVLNYFQGKCDLEDVDFFLYTKYKNLINALFGMCLTDITHPNITYDGKWHTIECNTEEAIEKYFESRNSFLAYQWGVWIVGLARVRLAEPYKYLLPHLIYSDTDSWKLTSGYDKSVFLNINKRIIDEAGTYDVKPYAYRKDGTREYLGVWEFEGTYKDFKTLGSKKYAVKKYDKKKGRDVIEVTVSGLSKEDGSEYLEKMGGVEAFKDGLLFPEEWSGRTYSVYDDDNTIRKLTLNGCTFTTSSSMAIHNTTYLLSRQGEYVTLLDKIRKYGIENIN